MNSIFLPINKIKFKNPYNQKIEIYPVHIKKRNEEKLLVGSLSGGFKMITKGCIEKD